MNHATLPYATTNDTTNPIPSTIHPCASILDTPMGFSVLLPCSDFSSVYPVATTIVGIDKKNENSNADALDIPANCPAAIVDIDRDVPGNTADKIWHAPIQIACGKLISSMCHVWIRPSFASSPAASALLFRASINHITIPPISSDAPITYGFSRCFPITFTSKNDGTAVTTNATATKLNGCVN